jgi:hypothetical protein
VQGDERGWTVAATWCLVLLDGPASEIVGLVLLDPGVGLGGEIVGQHGGADNDARQGSVFLCKGGQPSLTLPARLGRSRLEGGAP